MAKSRRGYNFSKGHLSVIPYPIIMIASQEHPLLRLLDDLPILKANEIVLHNLRSICKVYKGQNLDAIRIQNAHASVVKISPLTVTAHLQWHFWHVPNDWFVTKLPLVTVTLAYSDTFPMSRGCHCKRGILYCFIF